MMAGPSGSTPTLALPFPIPDDTVDVPRDIQALAVALDGRSSLAPPLVSTLPTNPTDGQEIYFLADAANNIIWHLRRRGSSWEYLGGPPLHNTVAAQEGTSSTTYVNLATVGPQVTVPLAGDYRISGGSEILTSSVAGSGGIAAVQIGATPTGSLDRVALVSAANIGAMAARTMVRTAIPATTVLRLQYVAQAGTATFLLRWLEVTPIRVG